MDDLGLTRAELARRMGKSQAWVSKALRGTQNLTLDSIAHIGFVLGVRWDPVVYLAPRESTPAESDPPMPAWVESENELAFQSAHYVGAYERLVALAEVTDHSRNEMAGWISEPVGERENEWIVFRTFLQERLHDEPSEPAGEWLHMMIGGSHGA